MTDKQKPSISVFFPCYNDKEDSIDLVLKSVELMQGGEIFTFKMPSVSLIDLANIFVKKYYPMLR